MGIINNQMGPQAGAMKEMPATAEQEAPVEGKEKSSDFMSGVEKSVPPEMMEAFERVVLAGKKVMYSPQMEDTIKQELAGDAPIEKKLAEAITGLMVMLNQQAKPRIPEQVIVPAAIELLYDAADFVKKAGLAPDITPEQVKTATQLMTMLILKGSGANDQQIGEAMTGNVKQPDAGQAPPEQPAAAAGGPNGGV